MQRSPLYLVGRGWVGEDFEAPRSGAFLWQPGVHGVLREAPENAGCENTRREHSKRVWKTRDRMHAQANARKCISEGRARASECISRLLSRAPAQCLPITLNSLRSVSVSLENGALSTVGVNQHR